MEQNKKNKLTGLVILGVVAGMIGLSFAAVPLYSLFCRVTGFGGTTQVAAAAPGEVLEREITVRRRGSCQFHGQKQGPGARRRNGPV